MTQKERAGKLCDELINAWLLHRTREEASEIALRYLEEAVKEWIEKNGN